MLQMPAWFAVSVAGDVPARLQIVGVVVASVTGSPELEVALTGNGATPYVTAEMTGNVMACGTSVTRKARVNGGAAERPAAPGWVAVRLHVPGISRFTV